MRIGFARREITPPLLSEGDTSIPILGWWWARVQAYREIHDPLHARAMALEDGAARAVVMSCDLFGDAVGFTGRAAQMIAERHGLKPEHVFIACTHAHTSPDTLNIGRSEGVAQWWLDDLVKELAQTADEALMSARESTLRWAEVELPGLVENRRAKLVEPYEKEHGPLEEAFRARATAVDETLRVLWAVDSGGEPFGAVANYACHPVIMQTVPIISADYCGPAARGVEDAFGGDFVCLYLNGPCGDIDPACKYSYDYADCEKTGGAIAAKTESLIRDTGAAPVNPSPIAGALGGVEVARQEIDKDAVREQEKALEAESERATAAGKSVKDEDHPLRELVKRKEILRAGEMPPTSAVTVHALRLGEMSFISFPGELLTALGQDVRAGVGGKVMLGVCTRGHAGYICPREAFLLGGYEIGPGTWSWLKGGCGEQIADKAIELSRNL